MGAAPGQESFHLPVWSVQLFLSLHVYGMSGGLYLWVEVKGFCIGECLVQTTWVCLPLCWRMKRRHFHLWLSPEMNPATWWLTWMSCVQLRQLWLLGKSNRNWCLKQRLISTLPTYWWAPSDLFLKAAKDQVQKGPPDSLLAVCGASPGPGWHQINISYCHSLCDYSGHWYNALGQNESSLYSVSYTWLL